MNRKISLILAVLMIIPFTIVKPIHSEGNIVKVYSYNSTQEGDIKLDAALKDFKSGVKPEYIFEKHRSNYNDMIGIWEIIGDIFSLNINGDLIRVGHAGSYRSGGSSITANQIVAGITGGDNLNKYKIEYLFYEEESENNYGTSRYYYTLHKGNANLVSAPSRSVDIRLATPWSSYRGNLIAVKITEVTSQGSQNCDTTELENKIKSLEAQITQLKSDLATKTTSNDTLTKENGQLKKDKADLEEKLKKAEDTLASIKTKIASIVDGAGPDTSANLDKLNQQVKDLQTEVNGYKNKVKELQAEIDKLKGRNKELEDLVNDTVIPKGPWTVPVEAPEGYTIKGLETPIQNTSEVRNIEIVSSVDKELTVDNFDIVITNPLKAPRTVYSSIVWLGAGHIEGKNDKQLLNSTKYNLTVYKGDRVELRVNSQPYTINKKSSSDESIETLNNINKNVSKVVNKVVYDRKCDPDTTRQVPDVSANSACEARNQAAVAEANAQYQACIASHRAGCWPNTDTRCENAHSCAYPSVSREACSYTKTEIVKGECRDIPRTVQEVVKSTEPQGTYTLTTTTTTDTYTASDINARVKAIEISGKDLGLKNNGTSKFEYTNSYVSKRVSTGKKDSNGKPAEINETPTKGTPNYNTNITNSGYSVESTAKEPKEIQVIKQPAGTVAEKFTIQPGETKDLDTYKGIDIKVESLSEPKAPSVADQLINLKKQVAELEAKLKECQEKCATADECARDKAALQKELDELKKKVNTVVDSAGSEIGKDYSQTLDNLKEKVIDLESKIKSLTAENTKLKDDLKSTKDELSKLKAELEALKKAKTNSDNRIKELENQAEKDKAAKEKVDTELAKEKADNANKQKQIDNLQAEIDRISDKLKNIQDESDKIDKEISDSKAIVDNKDKGIKKIDTENADLQKQINEEKAKPEDQQDKDKITNLENKIADNNKLKDQIAEEKKAAEKDLEDLNKKKVNLESKIDSVLNGDIEKLKDDLANTKKALQEANDRIKKLEDKIDGLNDKVTEAQAKLDELAKEVADKQKEIDEINNQIADKQAKIDELNNRINDNETAKKKLQDKLAEEEAKPEGEKDPAIIADLKNQIAEKEAEGQKLADQKKALEDEISNLEAQKKLLEDEIAALKDKIKALEDAIAALLSGDYEKTKKDLEKSKKKNEDLEKANKDADNKAKELEKEIEDLNRRLKDAEDNSGKLNEDLKKAQDEINKLDNQLKDKQKELEDINDKIAQNEKEQKEIQDKIDAEKSKPESEQDKDLINKLEKELKDKKSEHKSLIDKKKALEDEIVDLKKKIADLEDAIRRALNRDSASPDSEEARIIKKLMNGETLTPAEIEKIKELLNGNKLTEKEKSVIRDLLDKNRGRGDSKRTLDSIKDSIINNSGNIINPFDRTLRNIDDVIKDKAKDLNKIAKELLDKLDPKSNVYTKEMLNIASELRQALNNNKVTQELIDKFNNIFNSQKSVKKSNTLASILAKTPKDGLTQDYVIIFPIGRNYYIDNGQRVDIDVSSYASNGRTMLPIRYVANSLGYSVQWHQDTKTVEFTNISNPVLNQGTFVLDINTGVITGPNVRYTMDVKPEIKNERTFVSISNIVKAFGGTHGNTNPNTKYTIEWNKDMYSAILNKFVR